MALRQVGGVTNLSVQSTLVCEYANLGGVEGA